MNDQSPKAIARRFIQAWNAGGQGVVDELAHPDLLVHYSHFPQPLRGREAFKEALTQTFASFPDMRIEADEPLVAGDRAVVQWRYRGTHQAGELFGVQPGGTTVRVDGITVYRIVDGQVVEERGIVDNLGLLQQIGALASPA